MPARCWPRSNRHWSILPSNDPRSPTRTAIGRAASTANADRPAERVLRVSEAKIEALVNLAGELVVAKNALAHSAKRVEQDVGGHELARSIQRDT